jgi:hypothetical protein
VRAAAAVTQCQRSRTPKLGVTVYATDRAMSPIELAGEAEARGFYCFYIRDHT